MLLTCFMYISDRTPGIGYYNGDEYPDIMLQFSIGLGFPIYDYESVSFRNFHTNIHKYSYNKRLNTVLV